MHASIHPSVAIITGSRLWDLGSGSLRGSGGETEERREKRKEYEKQEDRCKKTIFTFLFGGKKNKFTNEARFYIAGRAIGNRSALGCALLGQRYGRTRGLFLLFGLLFESKGKKNSKPCQDLHLHSTTITRDTPPFLHFSIIHFSLSILPPSLYHIVPYRIVYFPFPVPFAPFLSFPISASDFFSLLFGRGGRRGEVVHARFSNPLTSTPSSPPFRSVPQSRISWTFLSLPLSLSLSFFLALFLYVHMRVCISK